MAENPEELVRVIQVGREPIYLIGDPVAEVLIDGKIVVVKGGEIEAAEIMDATSFEPRFNPVARHSTHEPR